MGGHGPEGDFWPPSRISSQKPWLPHRQNYFHPHRWHTVRNVAGSGTHVDFEYRRLLKEMGRLDVSLPHRPNLNGRVSPIKDGNYDLLRIGDHPK